LADLPASRRHRLARACAATRPEVVERAFPQLPAKDRSKLVAYAGPAFAATQLAVDDFVERLAPEDWSRIARHHPGLAIKAMTKRLEEQAEPSRTIIATLNGVMASTALSSPRDTLALLQVAAAHTPLTNLSYQRLAPLFPTEVAALILADGKERDPAQG
jgi:hypothetical protein